MKVEWTDASIADRTAIFDHIEADNPRAAADLDDVFVAAARLLRQHPEMGRPGKVPGTRELLPHRHYRLVYAVTQDAVQILAIAHTSRQWPPVTG